MNIGKRIYTKRFKKFGFIYGSRFQITKFRNRPNQLKGQVQPRAKRESCCVVVVIFHVPHMLLFAGFEPVSFAIITLVTVTAVYFLNGALSVYCIRHLSTSKLKVQIRRVTTSGEHGKIFVE